MPQRWHFTGGRRIAPIYVVPDIGWAVTDRVSLCYNFPLIRSFILISLQHEHEVLFQGDYQPRGNHGYGKSKTDALELQSFTYERG